MAEQLTFDLPVMHALGREDFYISPSNQEAVDAIDAWQEWPLHKFVLIGPEGSGKTHLAQIWAENAGATILNGTELSEISCADYAQKNLCVEDVDNIDSACQTALFHLHNIVFEAGHSLLMTGTGLPKHWGVSLPDLASRISAAGFGVLDAPDDALLAAVLMKQFSDRQINLEPRVVSYLLPRMERSFDFVSKLVVQLDAEALKQRKPINTRLAGKVLDSLLRSVA